MLNSSSFVYAPLLLLQEPGRVNAPKMCTPSCVRHFRYPVQPCSFVLPSKQPEAHSLVQRLKDMSFLQQSHHGIDWICMDSGNGIFADATRMRCLVATYSACKIGRARRGALQVRTSGCTPWGSWITQARHPVSICCERFMMTQGTLASPRSPAQSFVSVDSVLLDSGIFNKGHLEAD
ncbi:hypothetical protein K402DRAFT_126103 [Aulographum hederae CBS 113979]|uniref:Uncharacterized protein n=1 Tax=Aulographum hederae CBS 113979 TaxID=1176131 RepID=A0A6G1HEK6_9PEZI|nr:hypothetical protein K402DRAFT_126103 [Aulographum hederae CBS 113979]